MSEDPKDVRTKISFSDNINEISKAHVIEIMRALGAYKEGLSIVGGWAPYFILDKYGKNPKGINHLGSVDIDIAVNPEVIDDTQYASLEVLLKERGYEKHPVNNFSYVKKVTTDSGREVSIVIDFLAPTEEGRRSHRHTRVQSDFMVRKTIGADLAFSHRFQYTLEGKLPNGSDSSVEFYVADIVAMIAMKSYVLGVRYKEKDAYDLYMLIMYYKDGVSSVAAEIKDHIDQIPVPEGIENLITHFATRTSDGPSFVADFHGDEGEAREQRMTEAHLQVQRLLELLESQT